MTSKFRRSIAVVLAMLGATLFVAVARGELASAGHTWHVAVNGNDSAVGDQNRPLRTISAAVDRAASGDIVEVRNGTYRESIQVYGKSIHIRAAAGQRPIIDGSTPVSGWRREGGAWVVDGWTTQFKGDFGAMVPSNNLTAGLPDQVFINGWPQTQAASRAELVSGSFYHDAAADRIWLADDPTGKQVDVSNRSWGIYLNNAHGSRLTNLTVRRFATERRHMAAIRAYSNNVVLDGVVAEQNAAIGISVIGQNVTVRNGRANENGYMGVHADRATNVNVERMSIVGNNLAGFDPFHSAAGLKVTQTTGLTVRNSHVAYNNGPGVWTDIDSRNINVVRNLVESNQRSGIEIELSSNTVVAGNTSINNGESGIWILESTQAQVWNNAAFGNQWQIRVEEGPRRDVQSVKVRNNVVGSTGAGVELLHVNDWTEQRSAAQMGVTSNNTLFWAPAGSARTVSLWGRWPSQQAISSSLQAHRASTGQGSGSRVVGGNLPAVDAGCGDYRVPDGFLGSEPLPASIANLLGVTPGTARAVGPPTATPRLSTGGFFAKAAELSTDESSAEIVESATGELSTSVSGPATGKDNAPIRPAVRVDLTGGGSAVDPTCG